MSSLAALFLAIVLAAAGIGFLFFLSSRALSWAKKRGGGGELFGGGSASVGSALNPAEAIAQEQRRVKHSEDESGDPDEPGASA